MAQHSSELVSPSSGVWKSEIELLAGHAPSEMCREESHFPGLFQLLRWLLIPGSCFTPVSASVVTWNSPCVSLGLMFHMLFSSPCKDSLSCGIRAHTNDLILTRLNLQRPSFQMQPHLQVLGTRTSAHLFWKTQFNYNKQYLCSEETWQT